MSWLFDFFTLKKKQKRFAFFLNNHHYFKNNEKEKKPLELVVNLPVKENPQPIM